jgi:hypothetical protein
MLVTNSGGIVRIKWHTPHRTIENGKSDIENPLRPTGRTTDLKSDKSHTKRSTVVVKRSSGRRNEVSNEDTNGTDVDIFEPM